VEFIGKLRAKAIYIGAAADLFGSILATLVLGVIWGIHYVMTSNLSAPPTPEKMAEVVAGSTSFMVASLIVGLVFSALGGFVTAWLAKENEMPNALVLGGAMTIMGALTTALGPPLYPDWYLIASFSLVLPATMLGARLRLATKVWGLK